VLRQLLTLISAWEYVLADAAGSNALACCRGCTIAKATKGDVVISRE